MLQHHIVQNRGGQTVIRMNSLYEFIPKEGVQILLVLFLSFLIGLEREEHKAIGGGYGFGGVRTFPLIGLIGFGIGMISGQTLLLPGAGLLTLGALLCLSYQHKLARVEFAGMTTEVTAALTYVIGLLVHWEAYWIATTITVIAVGLLELKNGLEDLTKRVPGEEILTFAKFLLLTAVILPIVPDTTIGNFGFNPRKTWWVIVAVSAVSYGSYLLLKATKEGRSIFLSALLGGLYSSTVTTVVLSKRAKTAGQPHLYAGSTLVASGVMYLRLIVLIAFFSRALFLRLRWEFLLLTVIGVVGGYAWGLIPDRAATEQRSSEEARNPLEMRAAFFFGGLFVLLLYVTHFAVTRLGSAGLYSLAGIMGLTDIVPFVLGLTQPSAVLTPIGVAAIAIAIAASSNNIVKGIYVFSLADRKTGVQSLALLALFAILGLAPLVW